MSGVDSEGRQPDFSNLYKIDSSEAKKLLTEVQALRRRLVDAWQERAVILTREEQLALKQEIADTCEILTALTSRA